MTASLINVMAMGDESETQDKLIVKVLPTADIHRIPVEVSMNNSIDITACEFYLSIPEGVTDYLYDEEEEDYVYDKSSRWTNSHNCFINKGTIYHPNDLYVSITSSKTVNFKNNEGAIITLYFDGSKVANGAYNIQIIDPMIIWSDKKTTESHNTPENDQNFTVEDGKVYPGDVKNSCFISFNVDGKTLSTEEYPVGAAIIFPEMPAKTGHTFSGWPEGSIAQSDTTFCATYNPIRYLIKYIVDGNVFKSDSLNYGSTITPPQAPLKTGYTFIDWGDVAETVTGDATYTAIYTVNKYEIKYIAEGNVVRTDSLDYGSAITPPQAPQKTGYTFIGWGDVAETVTGDATYTAIYTVNKYEIKYIAEGNVVRTDSLDYGSAITPPEAPQKTGYTFKGWGNVAETVTGNATYTAIYTINKYEVKFLVDGDVFKTDSLEYGSEITLPEPTKDGWFFKGWGETETTMPDHDLVYNAIFQMLGDVNLDDQVNSTDVVNIFNFIALGEDSSVLEENADVNLDGAVNAADATTVYNYIVFGTSFKSRSFDWRNN
ncbi:MAG: InlB B-repeat-containing protein [Bacteroidaceae bacterium]|nr:InlB B-repeat-containing protein [Bacteroidaceae bacterium]